MAQKLFPGKPALPTTTPFQFSHLFALQHNWQSIQSHAWLPDHRRPPKAILQIPDDAAFPHLRKNNSYHYAGLHAHSKSPPPLIFKAFCLINFCTLSIYLHFGDSQLTLWLFFSVMEIFVDFPLYMEYNAYRKFK